MDVGLLGVGAIGVGDAALGLWNYWAVMVLMMIGLYIVIANDNLVKKMMGLNIFQVSVILFYVSIGKVDGGTAPIVPEGVTGEVLYSNPLPHVLMLTAIVVGVATMAVGLALVVRIHEDYGTTEEDEIAALDHRELYEQEQEQEQELRARQAATGQERETPATDAASVASEVAPS